MSLKILPKLTIELVPKTSWYTNLRSVLSKNDWDIMRKIVYRRASYKCEICGMVGIKHPVEAHEIWLYDDITHIQKLDKVMSLCPNCHQVKHFGFARVKGNEKLALVHLCKINNWNEIQGMKYIDSVFELWKQRSNYNWKLDIQNLLDYIEKQKKLKKW